VALVLFLPRLGIELGLEPGIALTDQASAGKRPEIWRLGLEAITARPWLGWGWSQGGEAHVALASGHPSLQILIGYMHNLALDLMVWNGVPLGALVLLGLGLWFLQRWRSAVSGQQRLLLLAISLLVLHAMLELPHGHAVFILPAGLMIGIVEARSRADSVLNLSRLSVGAVALGLSVVLAMLLSEFREVGKELMMVRMRAARIANLPAPEAPPRLLLMAPFGELLASLRVEPGAPMDAAGLDRLRRLAYHFPSTGNLLRLALTSALNGRPDAAREALTLICQLQPPADCLSVAGAWRHMAHTIYPALLQIEVPEPPSPLQAVGGAASAHRHGVKQE
jgi:hypothetical protein